MLGEAALLGLAGILVVVVVVMVEGIPEKGCLRREEWIFAVGKGRRKSRT